MPALAWPFYRPLPVGLPVDLPLGLQGGVPDNSRVRGFTGQVACLLTGLVHRSVEPSLCWPGSCSVKRVLCASVCVSAGQTVFPGRLQVPVAGRQQICGDIVLRIWPTRSITCYRCARISSAASHVSFKLRGRAFARPSDD